jgi:hypothetical protein
MKGSKEMSMKVGQVIGYFDGTKKRTALVKAIGSKVDNDHQHKLAAATSPSIDLVYVDESGTTQTVTAVAPLSTKAAAATTYYFEGAPVT